jgi:hypothetical protein
MSLVRILMVLCMILPTSSAFAADESLGLSAVKSIRIIGEPGSVVLTTRADAPFVGTITHRRQGWIGQLLSLWSYGECATTSSMRLEGDTLIVTVASSNLSSCHVVVTANVREGNSVTVEQPAGEIELNGVFDQVKLNSDASNFNLNGEARDIVLKANALKAKIAYTAIHGNETILINAKLVEADLHFTKVDAISYRIDADAAMVNSRYPHTPGAKPDIRVAAEKAKVNID